MVVPQAANTNTDNTNQVLMQVAQNKRVDQYRQQQLQQDDEKRKYELLQSINPATLSEKFDSEIVNQSLGAMRYKVKEYLKNNPNSFELQSFVQDEVGKIAGWNSKVKAVRSKIGQGIREFNMAGFDKASVQAKALDNALYSIDENGQKVLKDPEDIDVEGDYIGDAVKNPRNLVNRGEAYNVLDGMLKDAQANPITQKRTVVRQRGKVKSYERVDVTHPYFMDWEDETDSPVIKGQPVEYINPATGKKEKKRMVDDDTFNKFNSQPAVSVIMESEAEKMAEHAGVNPEDQGNMYLFKKAWLSDYLASRAGVKSSDEKRDIVLPPTRVKVEIPESQKRDKEYEIFPKTLKGALNLDPEVLSSGEPAVKADGKPMTLKDGTQLVRIDHLFNGGSFNGRDSNGKKASLAVFANPNKKGSIYVSKSSDDPLNGDLKRYDKGVNLDKFAVMIAELNGSDVKTVRKMLGLGSTAAGTIKK